MIKRKFIYIILILVLALSILGVIFQMQLRGYTKIGEINEVRLYYKQYESCALAIEQVYSDENGTYYLSCMSSQYYLVKEGKQEYSIQEALNEDIITIEEAMFYFHIFREP